MYICIIRKRTLQEHLKPSEARLQKRLEWIKRKDKRAEVVISGGALAHMNNVAFKRSPESWICLRNTQKEREREKERLRERERDIYIYNIFPVDYLSKMGCF